MCLVHERAHVAHMLGQFFSVAYIDSKTPPGRRYWNCFNLIKSSLTLSWPKQKKCGEDFDECCVWGTRASLGIVYNLPIRWIYFLVNKTRKENTRKPSEVKRHNTDKQKCLAIHTCRNCVAACTKQIWKANLLVLEMAKWLLTKHGVLSDN